MNSKVKEAIDTLEWYINNEMGGYERQTCLNALNTISEQPILVVHCRNCNLIRLPVGESWKFCPNCGAQMK